MSLFLLYDGITQAYDYVTMIRQMQDVLGGELFAARQARVMYAFIGLAFIAEIIAGGISLWCFVTTPSVKRLQCAVLALAVLQILTIDRIRALAINEPANVQLHSSNSVNQPSNMALEEASASFE